MSEPTETNIPGEMPSRRRKGVRPTGQCHSCDVPVSGERLYCGVCAATRNDWKNR